ncbi:MAG: hypothetical protein HY717_14605 [Planctomycetes bacterium]|nr:hypothetical protein [Planctomycetota bacterium]
MSSSFFQKIWEENKRFLLIAGGGLAAFLLLNAILVTGYKNQALGKDGTIERNRLLEVKVQRLYKEVRDRFHEEKNMLESYAHFERDYLQRFSIPPQKNLPDFRKGTSAQIYFNDQIEKIWGEVSRKAREINCLMPEKITTQDLGVLPDDTAEDTQRHFIYLEILRRALNAMVDSGMKKIDKPKLHEEEPLPVKGNPAAQIVYQRLTVQVQGTYDSFLQLLRKCQEPNQPNKTGQFLQVILLDLAPVSAGAASLLKGNLEFANFAIEEVKEEGAQPAAGGPRSKLRSQRRR